jgi:hypothetical protein
VDRRNGRNRQRSTTAADGGRRRRRDELRNLLDGEGAAEVDLDPAKLTAATARDGDEPSGG